MRTMCLAVENATHEKRIYPLVGTVTIGRNRDNTITLADRTVSRVHARLSCTEGQWTVEDLGSANGVEHQGQRITEKRLNLGDSFEIGMSVFRLVEEEIEAGDIPKYENQLANSRGLVDTLECCFDAQGSFDRQAFLNKTAVLAPNHERIFRLLLNHLKDSDSKKNRISLVNSIPALYDSVEGTRTAVNELLAEFCTSAEEINYHDRNVLMLASQLLRLYRKEDGLDIEATPEEVLRVQKGLCEDTIELGRITVGELQSELLKKLSTMHTALIDSLSKKNCKTSTECSPRFLFSLLREFYILMALIGGPSAKAIIWQGALATSSPNSRLYHQPLSKKFLDSILGLLRVVVRGCDRLVEENAEDIANLKTLKQRIRLLIPSAPKERQQSSLHRILDLLENPMSLT